MSKAKKIKIQRLFQRAAPKPKIIAAPNDVAVRCEETANAFRQQHGGFERDFIHTSLRGGSITMRHRAKHECWLDRYKRRGAIDAVQFAAGMMFRDAWLRCVHRIQTKDSVLFIETFKATDRNYGEFSYDRLMGSERIYRLCMKKLSPQQKLVVTDVCGEDRSAGSSARVRTLIRGLDALARESAVITRDENLWLNRQLEGFL